MLITFIPITENFRLISLHCLGNFEEQVVTSHSFVGIPLSRTSRINFTVDQKFISLYKEARSDSFFQSYQLTILVTTVLLNKFSNSPGCKVTCSEQISSIFVMNR